MSVCAVDSKPKISPAKKERRREAVRYAVSHNRIEGQFLDPEGATIFDAFIRGEIDQNEILHRLQEAAHGDYSYR
jgi:hypothetical protein